MILLFDVSCLRTVLFELYLAVFLQYLLNSGVVLLLTLNVVFANGNRSGFGTFFFYSTILALFVVQIRNLLEWPILMTFLLQIMLDTTRRLETGPEQGTPPRRAAI